MPMPDKMTGWPGVTFAITWDVPVTDAILNLIAHLLTEHLPKLIALEFFKNMTDANFMRIATLLARKSFDEAGCPIG